jgi:hypothetical protein
MYRYKKRKVEREAGKERVKREAKIKSWGYQDVYIRCIMNAGNTKYGNRICMIQVLLDISIKN